MTLTKQHPIFDEVLTKQGLSDDVLTRNDWARMREARKASHDAWFDQLDAKHKDAQRNDDESLFEYMKQWNAETDQLNVRKVSNKVSKTAAPKAPKARQKEANTE